MALNFPNSPTLDQIHTEEGKTWVWDGAAWIIQPLSTVTGGGNDQIFWENSTNVTVDYTITDGKNAMSAGPITIDNGITVTVGVGETWTIV